MLYISAFCNDDDQGKKLLHSVMNTLLTIPLSINSESNDAVQSETAESGCAVQDETAESSFTAQSDPGEGKPTLLWSALYIQELTLVCCLWCFFLVWIFLVTNIVVLCPWATILLWCFLFLE